MATRVSGVVLMLALFHAGTVPAAARHEAGSDEERVTKIRSEILKRGVGHDAMVKVRLTDGTDVKGFVDRAGESDFAVTDGNGTQRTIVYGDVSRLSGSGLPLAAKISIGIGVGVAVFLALAYIEFRDGLFDGGF